MRRGYPANNVNRYFNPLIEPHAREAERIEAWIPGIS